MCFISLLLRQSGYSQHLGRLQEGAERSLVHIHFAMVDELDQCVEICERYILEYDDWMFAGCALKQFSEVGTARGQDDAVGLETSPVAGKRHVDKVLVVAQVFESRGDTALIVVPSQAKVLCVYHRVVDALGSVAARDGFS